MLGIQFKFEDRFKRVDAAVERAALRNIPRAAYAVAQDAKNSIGNDPKPSAPGDPPHTRGRRVLPKAIRYAADRRTAVIGTTYSMIGTAGAAHEHGEFYKGDQFDERAFMGPALERQAPRFADSFEGSIGGN